MSNSYLFPFKDGGGLVSLDSQEGKSFGGSKFYRNNGFSCFSYTTGSVLFLEISDDKIRKKVSQDRHRFQDDEYDLDLTYITNNVIAMGIPASGIQKIWRNSIDESAAMLKKYHDDHFMIWLDILDIFLRQESFRFELRLR
jgi:hypothetical protein